MAQTTLTADKAGAARRVEAQGASPEKRERYRNAAVYIIPALLGIFIFSIIPIIFTLLSSFTNRNTFHFPAAPDLFGPPRPGAFTFIGLKNYGDLFWDSTTQTYNTDIFSVLGNTVLYAVVCVGLFFAVGLGLALLMTSPYVK